MATRGIPPPEERRRVGWTKPESPLWWRRYNRLRDEGFTHDEAARLATGIVGSRDMMRGRERRRKWRDDVMSKIPDLTAKEYEDAVDALYDEFDWADPWTQFYPEGVGAE